MDTEAEDKVTLDLTPALRQMLIQLRAMGFTSYADIFSTSLADFYRRSTGEDQDSLTIVLSPALHSVFAYFQSLGFTSNMDVVRRALAEYFRKNVEDELDRCYIESYHEEPEDVALGEAQLGIIAVLLEQGEL